MDAQPGSPKHGDQRAQPPPVWTVTGLPYDRDDLLDRRRIGGIAHALIARRPSGMESRHRRRRPSTTSDIKQHLGHGSSLGS